MLPGEINQCFVDSSALIALFSEKDWCHQQAFTAYQQLLKSNIKLVITNFIVAETHALLLRVSTTVAHDWLMKSAYQDFTVSRPDKLLEVKAKAAIAKYRDKDFSFTDMLSFLTMEKLGIKHYFSFDDHFSQIGKFINVSQVLLNNA